MNQHGKRPEWAGKPKTNDELPYEDAGVSQVLLQGGVIVRVVPGSYKELRPSGKQEIFVGRAIDAPGGFVCGPTNNIVAIWFAEVKPEVTEPPVTT